LDLAFRKYGEGKPVIILHGLFGQSDNWNTIAKKIAEHPFAVYTVDQRNHGLSPHDNEWNYTVMANDLQDFISQHELRDPIIIGHSMGGKTAMVHALKNCNTESKLIVVDVSPRTYEPQHDKVFEALNAVDFSLLETRKQAEEILVSYGLDFGTRQFLLKNVFWQDDKMDWRFNLKVITEKYSNVGEKIPNQTCNINTLVIRGGNSNYIADSDMDEFTNRFPNNQLVTIANAGHWVHAEKPDEFIKAILEFITQ